MSETTQPISIALTAEEWNVVGAGLMKLPGEVMFGVHAKISQQFAQAQQIEQARERAEAAKVEAKPVAAKKK